MEQAKVVSWFRKTYPGVLIFAIPNGGARDLRTAQRLKVEGVLAGVPDLFIPAWRLFVEMKIGGGRLSEKQTAVIDALSECGYRTEVCYGFEQAVQVIENESLNWSA